MTKDLEFISVEPAIPARCTVIWLHGLGADGYDFQPIVPELDLPDDTGIRFIFPHAPKLPVTINGGMVMRAWYDIAHPNLALQQDETGIRNSAGLVQKLVDAEFSAGRQVILAGFSQGGVIALHVGLRHSRKLAGIMVLSSYLALADSLAKERHPSNQDTPILQMHGVDDPIINIRLAERSRDLLQELGYTVEWKSYPMPHSVHPLQIRDIGKWLRSRLER